MPTIQQERLRRAVRFFYDLQKLRIQTSNRSGINHVTKSLVELTEEDKKFLDSTGNGLEVLEKQALKEVQRVLKGVPIYERWLKQQKGIGPTLSGVLISEIDIARCSTPSALWRYCGLAVDPATGRAERRVKGEKAKFSPWLKSKLLRVMGDCLIKANSPYKKFYNDYKHRKENTIVPVCMGCKGEGKARVEDVEGKPDPITRKRATKKVKCENCGGTGGPAPWGASKMHRHNAALRVLVKAFLLDLWTKWRELEGLPVTEPYAVAVLGRVHGDHAGMGRTLQENQSTAARRDSIEIQNMGAGRDELENHIKRAGRASIETQTEDARPKKKRATSRVPKETPEPTARQADERPKRPKAGKGNGKLNGAHPVEP